MKFTLTNRSLTLPEVWIDILIGLGFVVELCKVAEEGIAPRTVTMEDDEEENEGPERKPKKRRRKIDSKTEPKIISLVSDEEDGPTKAALSRR